MLKIISYSISRTSKFLFLGSDNFAYHPLVTLSTTCPNLHVVTHHTELNIKSINKVQQLCETKSIPYSTPIHKTTKQETLKQWEEFRKFIENKEYDLGIICSYGFMIPQKIIRYFKDGMIVIHPSLLPKHRGGAPIFHAIANGDRVSGISFIQTSVNKFDAGNILYQTEVEIPEDPEYNEVQELLSKKAADKIMHVIDNLESLRPGTKQNKQQQTKAPIVRSKFLDFKQPSAAVFNLSRAIKGPRVRLDGKQIIVKLKRQYIDVESGIQPGTVFMKTKKSMFIACGDGRAVRLDKFKEPSKVFFNVSAFKDKYLKDGTVIFT